MPRNTLIIVGPGGVGKSPLTMLLRDYVAEVDPYRLRSEGPRNSDDSLYAPPKLRSEFTRLLEDLGDSVQEVPCTTEQVQWFPKGKVLFFTVRGEWQCMMLGGLHGDCAKVEVYAPVLPSILAITDVGSALGQVHTLVLNPAGESVASMRTWKELEEKTRENCERRNDSAESVLKRMRSIVVEAPAWKQLVQSGGAMECVGWPFPEYIYGTRDKKEVLLEVRHFLLKLNRRLGVFFRSGDEIRKNP